MKKNDDKIDFVIAWVDGNDKEWQVEKEKYSSSKKTVANSYVRYRDWDQLRYWFRGVEKFAPWVNKIFFVTCGQKPEWLDENNSKLVLVNHRDYIDKKFLPTFSANPIELNFNKIKELSEQFVYFNDDMFIINKVKKEDFFKKGLPCDDFKEIPLFTYGNGDVFPYILMNDMELVNKYFDKQVVMKKHWKKLLNYRYGLMNNLKTILMMPYNKFSSVEVNHIPSSFLKSVLDEVWKKEEDLLNQVSANKFRTKADVNQYIFKYWQFFSGKFFPRTSKFGRNFPVGNNNEEFIKAIKYKTVCLNDSEFVDNFEKVKSEINKAFEEKLPEKCSFEK